MDMDMNAMKAEIGGAFVVAWLVMELEWAGEPYCGLSLWQVYGWHSQVLMCYR